MFDEVDAGIGGAAALAVGRSLAAIADDHQVLVVTHLAQVAAWADAHVVVDKQVEGDTTLTTVEARRRRRPRRPSWPGCCRAPPTRATARDHARELLDAAAPAASVAEHAPDSVGGDRVPR